MLKRTFLFIFFIYNMPLHSMTTVTRRVAPQLTTQRLTLPNMTSYRQGFRSFHQTKPAFSLKKPNSTPTSSTSSWLSNFNLAAIKDSLSRYWYGIPAIEPVRPLDDIRSKLIATQSEELIKTLSSPSFSFHKSPNLCNQVKDFLEKNIPEQTQKVFTLLITHKINFDYECLEQLHNVTKNNLIFARKMLLLTENFLNSNPTNIENLAYILSAIPNKLDPLKLDQLKYQFWNNAKMSYSIAKLDQSSFTQLLPQNTTQFVDAIINFCKHFDENDEPFQRRIIVNKFAESIKQKKLTHSDLERLISKLAVNKYSRIVINSSEILSNIAVSKISETLLPICNNNPQAPSCRHLLKYHDFISPTYLPTTEPGFLNMIKTVIAKEKEAMNDNEVFYHGRWWQYGFLSDIFGALYSHASGTELKDFVFPHLNDPATGKLSERFFTAEQERREYLKQHGNPFSDLTQSMEKTPEAIEAFLNRQRLLFVNKFLFGNLGRRGSNSVDYIIHNYNQNQATLGQDIRKLDFSIEEIFSMFGYKNVYEQHEKELLALQEEYNALSQYGELLQILIPKNMVDKCVYYTTSGGPKIPYKLSDGTETTNINQILRDADQNPQDISEYAIIMTHDIALNPQSGIKVLSYNTVELEKWQVFQKKLKDFVENRLKPSLQQADMQKQHIFIKQHMLTITE